MLLKYVLSVIAMHYSESRFDDLVIAISENTAASASCRSMVISGHPGTVSCIQIRKLTFEYVYMTKFTIRSTFQAQCS